MLLVGLCPLAKVHFWPNLMLKVLIEHSSPSRGPLFAWHEMAGQ